MTRDNRWFGSNILRSLILFWNGSREERVLIAIKTRRKYSKCVRSQKIGSCEQAGEVSRMELRKGRPYDLCRKEASGHSSCFPGNNRQCAWSEFRRSVFRPAVFGIHMKPTTDSAGRHSGTHQSTHSYSLITLWNYGILRAAILLGNVAICWHPWITCVILTQVLK